MSRLCIVFDLDDTLYLENDYVFSGFRTVGKWIEATMNIAGFSDCAQALYKAGAGNNTFQTALASVGCQPDSRMLTEMLTVYRTHEPDITLPADSCKCLTALANEAELGIITDGRPFAQYAKCGSLGLKHRVKEIICTGVWGEQFYKPHHRAFEFMEGAIGAKADTYFYVADNPTKDFTAPLARGWKAIRIRRSGGLHSHVEPASGCRPHLELSDLWQLPAIIREHSDK